MRKFDVRWWVTGAMLQWRYMSATGQTDTKFFAFPWYRLQRVDGGATVRILQ